MSTVMTWQTKSTASAETEKLGEQLGRLLNPPAVVELRSDLGGGKTTFVRGLVRGLGSKDTVTSPTFTLNQIYQAKNGIKISHHDLYRLDQAGIIADELAEDLADDQTVTVVEWAGIVKDVLPNSHLSVEFRPVAADADERQIIFTYPESMNGVITQLETNWTNLEP